MLTVGLNSCPNSQSFLVQLPTEIISQIVDYCPSSSIPALSIVCKSTQEFVRGLQINLVEFWPRFYVDCIIYNVSKFFMMDLASNGPSNHVIFHISHSSHLQDVAGETLRTVTIVGSGFAGPLARHASNYLTNLKVLGLMHLSFMEIELFSTEQLCEEVKLLLPNLPQLQRLIMGRMHSVSTQTQTLDYAEGHKQVVEFSSICPGLDFVCLPDDTEWNRIRIPNKGSSYFYIWFPEVSQFSVASAWQLLDILCAEGRKYPSWLSLLKLILKEAVGKWYLNEARENASNGENGPDIQESIRTAIETLLNEIDKRVEGN
ncbi:hypothetical protein GG344DRAFT_68502 [Lentinula edodes]|nr:hypothetical protein GG344DRAFT_68502 [Lentinula edodes]